MADAAIPAGGVGWASEWRHRVLGALADKLAAEGERRLLWLPVFFGGGIGVYFALKFEPSLWAASTAAAASIGAVFALRRCPGWREAALVLAGRVCSDAGNRVGARGGYAAAASGAGCGKRPGRRHGPGGKRLADRH